MIDKKMALISLVFVFLLSVFVSYSYFLNYRSTQTLSPISSNDGKAGTAEKNPDGTDVAVTDEPRTEECPLNGKMQTKAEKANWEKRRPLGIMVENHLEARPQSGLSSADIIYEAVAEGGITRFLTIFYCQDSKYVGPVRSARIYFLQLLEGYGANPLYAHVGGANTDGPADALGQIEKIGWALYNDLNQFSVPFPNFWRDYERLPNRATEHTVYTATSKLWDYAAGKRGLTNVDKKGKAWNASFTSWKFSDDAKQGDRGTVANISFGFWTSFASDYAVVWKYDKVANSYKRENGGAAHIDKDTDKRLEAKNIIVVFAKESLANDGYEGGQHILYKVTGSGDAIVFQNGKAIQGTWTKKSVDARMKFTDENGKEISIVRGQVFVEILPIGNKVTY